MKKSEHKTWIEISIKKTRQNIINIKKYLGSEILLMAVVKSNAYGLGIREIVTIIDGLVDWYGVDNVAEAELIGQLSLKPVLIMDYVAQDEFIKVISRNFRIMGCDYDQLRALSIKAGDKNVKIHIKVDTGLNRFGVSINDLPRFLSHIQKLKNVKIEGLYTHYARLMDEKGVNICNHQLSKYIQAKKILNDKGVSVTMEHTASSLAAILFQETRFNMVRTGILIHGLWGSKEIKEIVKDKGCLLKLAPTFSFKTRIVSLKEVSKGQSLGYLGIWGFDKKIKIAIVGAGYYDGIDRRYSENGRVLIKGKFAKIVGKIAMNTFMVDVSEIINVNIGDTVIIIGKSGANEISAYDLAIAIGGSTYEVMTRLNPILPRILL